MSEAKRAGRSLTRAHRERLCWGSRSEASSAKLNGLGFALWAVGSHGRLGVEEEQCQMVAGGNWTEGSRGCEGCAEGSR